MKGHAEMFGITVSGHNCKRIAFGGWAIGGQFTTGVSDSNSLEALETAYHLGIRLIDTAPVYGNGHSEKLIGRFLKSRDRDHVFIATKFGMSWKTTSSGTRTMIRNTSGKALLKEVEGSLRRLRTDYIDLYQVHWPDPVTPVQETMDSLNHLKEQGKIRFVGVSNFSLAGIKEIEGDSPLDAVQGQYNLLSREYEGEFFDYLKEEHTQFLSYGTLAYGLLSGKYQSKEFSSEDWRRRGNSPTNNYFSPGNFEGNIQKANRLGSIAEKIGVTSAQLAIAWTLRHSFIYTLVGAKNSLQVQENAKALSLDLSTDVLRKLDNIFPK